MHSLKTARSSEATPPTAVVGMCPLCHTVEPTATIESLEAGGDWTCVTCGQVWSARRIEAVAAYARYVAAH